MGGLEEQHRVIEWGGLAGSSGQDRAAGWGAQALGGGCRGALAGQGPSVALMSPPDPLGDHSPSPTFFFQEPRTPGTASWSRLMASLWGMGKELRDLGERDLGRGRSSEKCGGQRAMG